MNENNDQISKIATKPLRVQVPTSIDVKEIVKGLNLTPTRTKNIKNKIYYFLSRIVSTNDNFKLNGKNDGYRNISSVIMRKVMGREDYYLIIELLTNPIDPIIESNNSWRNSHAEGSVGYCKGYRITQKYNTGEVEYKSIPKKSHERIIKHVPEELEGELISDNYKFLLNQFKLHALSFDPSVYDYIRAVGNELLSRVENNNEYQSIMILNLIGRWLYYVESIEKNDLWHKVSPSNHRLNSSITNLKRILRPFLLCDGKPLGMIDISASQPYLLSALMTTGFLTNTSERFNLRTIYPEVWLELVSLGYISSNMNTTFTGDTFTNISSDAPVTRNKSLNNIGYSSSTNNFKCFANAPVISNSPSGSSTSSSNTVISTIYSPFMWGQFFNEEELESITRYQQSPFDQDFYKHLFNTYQSMTGRIEDFNSEKRQKLKDDIMFILFQDNLNHRNNVKNLVMFKMVFGGVDKWINQTHRTIGKGKFGRLLQRTESYLVLNVVCREFNQKFPSIPIITIHDAVLTSEEYLPDLQKLFLERFQEITGVKVGIKQKCEKPNPEPTQRDIDEAWSKIRPIKTKKAFQKKLNGVFTSNIERGSEFLKVID